MLPELLPYAIATMVFVAVLLVVVVASHHPKRADRAYVVAGDTKPRVVVEGSLWTTPWARVVGIDLVEQRVDIARGDARVALVVRVPTDESSLLAASSLVKDGLLDASRIAELIGTEFDVAMGNVPKNSADRGALAAALGASEPLAARLATLGLSLARVEPAA
jgi:hypothetical protein